MMYHAQDTLVFCRKNDPNKEFKLPLGVYEVRLKPKGHKVIKALVVGMKDSCLVYKKLKNDKATRKLVKEKEKELNTYVRKLDLSNEQFDSLIDLTEIAMSEIRYPLEEKMRIEQISKIKIDNKDRPEKKKLMKTAQAVLLISLPAFFISPLFVPPTAMVVLLGVLVAEIPVFVILETKRLNLKKKWMIKKLITT